MRQSDGAFFFQKFLISDFFDQIYSREQEDLLSRLSGPFMWYGDEFGKNDRRWPMRQPLLWRTRLLHDVRLTRVSVTFQLWLKQSISLDNLLEFGSRLLGQEHQTAMSSHVEPWAHPLQAGVLGTIDHASSALILELQINDIEQLLEGRKNDSFGWKETFLAPK